MAFSNSDQARLVTVAMANKTARIAWAVMVKGENFRVYGPAHDRSRIIHGTLKIERS